MPNLYGVANAPGLPIVLGSSNFGGNTACPISVYTNVCNTPALIAPSNGYFYAMANVTLVLSMGAALPSNIFVALNIGGGSFSGGVGMTCAGCLVSAQNNMTFSIFSAVSQSAWQGVGAVVGIGVQPLSNPLTVNQFSSGSVVLLRAPDQ